MLHPPFSSYSRIYRRSCARKMTKFARRRLRRSLRCCQRQTWQHTMLCCRYVFARFLFYWYLLASSLLNIFLVLFFLLLYIYIFKLNAGSLFFYAWVDVDAFLMLFHFLFAGPVGAAVKECRGAAELSARELARVHFCARHSAEWEIACHRA